jgi:hypothetical protein
MVVVNDLGGNPDGRTFEDLRRQLDPLAGLRFTTLADIFPT